MAIVLVLAVWGAAPAAGAREIRTDGPITHLTFDEALDCQVSYKGEGQEASSCFTSVYHNGTWYQGFGGVATVGLVSGSGTPNDPYTVQSVVDIGPTGLRLVQTDAYVVGSDAWETIVNIENSTDAAAQLAVVRFMNCTREGQETGFGLIAKPLNAPFCTRAASNSPPGPVLGLIDRTGGANYAEGEASELAGAFSGGRIPSNGCDCFTERDNAVSLAWPVTVEAHSSEAVAFTTTFAVPAAPPPTPGESKQALETATAKLQPPPAAERLIAGAPVRAKISGLAQAKCPCTVSAQLLGPSAVFGAGIRLQAQAVPVGSAMVRASAGQTTANLGVRLSKRARARLARSSAATVQLTLRLTLRDAYHQDRVKIRRVKIRRLRPPHLRPL